MTSIGDATQEQETHANSAQGYTARAYAARNSTSALGRATIQRRQPGPEDVQIDILSRPTSTSSRFRKSTKPVSGFSGQTSSTAFRSTWPL
jgi:hypothetical protein